MAIGPWNIVHSVPEFWVILAIGTTCPQHFHPMIPKSGIVRRS